MGYFDLAPRPIASEDAAGAHQLLIQRLGVTPYLDRAIEILTLAERGDDPEHRAYVVARDKTVVGLALFGSIAGTEAGFKLYVVAIESRETDIGARLVDAVATAVVEDHGRFMVAELADEPALATTIALLRSNGFAEVGRIPDYYRDGVPLTILRRDL
jgi:L-amino acid N-acyltransferase YncA